MTEFEGSLFDRAAGSIPIAAKGDQALDELGVAKPQCSSRHRGHFERPHIAFQDLPAFIGLFCFYASKIHQVGVVECVNLPGQVLKVFFDFLTTSANGFRGILDLKIVFARHGVEAYGDRSRVRGFRGSLSRSGVYRICLIAPQYAKPAKDKYEKFQNMELKTGLEEVLNSGVLTGCEPNSIGRQKKIRDVYLQLLKTREDLICEVFVGLFVEGMLRSFCVTQHSRPGRFLPVLRLCCISV